MTHCRRIIGGLSLATLALCALVVTFTEASVTGHAVRTWTRVPITFARRSYSNFEALIDVSTHPPTFLGSAIGSTRTRGLTLAMLSAAFDDGTHVRVSVSGSPYTAPCWWAPTHRGVSSELAIDVGSLDPDRYPTGTIPIHDAGIIRTVAVQGLRADFPDHPWIRPPGLGTAPLDPSVLRTNRQHWQAPHWPGIAVNAVTAAALAGLIWAVWPRRKQ